MKLIIGITTLSLAMGVNAAYAQVLNDASDGRLLASGCFQCHGTNGRNGGFDALAGDSKKDLLDKLKEMAGKNQRSNIMYPHAKGYTPRELDLIADYFSRLPKP